MRRVAVTLAAILCADQAHAAPSRHAKPLPPIPTAGELNESDLIRIGALGLTPARQDPFAAPEPGRYGGRRFTFRRTLAGPEADASPTWRYVLSAKQLTLSLHLTSQWLGEFEGPAPARGSYIRGAVLTKSERSLGRAVGQNAFGVRVPYDRTSIVGVILGEMTDREQPADDLEVTIPMEPEVARAETRAMVAEVSGVIESTAGPTSACGRQEKDATIDDPHHWTLTACAVPARIERIVYRGVGGKVLATWEPPAVSAPPSPTALPEMLDPIASPVWLRRPSPDDVAHYYPERAQRTGMTGLGVINCTATGTGSLEACEVVQELPDSYGFGAAALSLSRLYKLAPQDEFGHPVGGRPVRVEVRFSNPAG